MAADLGKRAMTVESFVELQRKLLVMERDEEVAQTTEVLRSYSNADLQVPRLGQSPEALEVNGGASCLASSLMSL